MSKEGPSIRRPTVGGPRLPAVPRQSQRLRDMAERQETVEAGRPAILNPARALIARWEPRPPPETVELMEPFSGRTTASLNTVY